MITIALAKGRLLEDIQSYLADRGLTAYADALESQGRSLYTVVDQVKFIYAKGRDVPVYVERGSADIGFVGSDIITEDSFDLLTIAQLPFGKCHFSLCGLAGVKEFNTVATTYEHIAFNYFREKRQKVDLIKLHGSVELAPILGLADGIVDIVQTGRTLRDNGLIEYAKIMDVTACLIANRQTFYTKEDEIYPFLKEIGVFQ